MKKAVNRIPQFVHIRHVKERPLSEKLGPCRNHVEKWQVIFGDFRPNKDMLPKMKRVSVK